MSELARSLDDAAGKHGIAVAVSGGVDSLTLWAFAHRHRRAHTDVVAFHAVSAAVPAKATERVRAFAARIDAQVTILDAGEMTDAEYLANPVDRCRVCKSHLYDTIAGVTSAQIVSGTNLDDMDDYRPGLSAARARGVRHPFVEARIDKRGVRLLARELGFADVSELPAQPCLSSRVETGIRIDADMLARIDAAEVALRNIVGNVTVRCRVRRDGFTVELDNAILHRLDTQARAQLVDIACAAGLQGSGTLAPYRMGSAFLRVVE